MRRFARTSFCVGRPTGSGVTLRPKVLVLLARDASRSSHGFRLDLLRRWRRGWDYPASRALRVWCSALLRLHSRAGSRTAFFIPQRNLDFSLRSKLAERVGLSRFAGSASLVLRTFTTALPRWQSNGVLHPTEKSRLFAALKIGGEGGIRTHGTFPFSGFQDRRNRPLCHLSSRTPKKHRECSNTGNIPFFFNRLKPRICFRGDVIKPGQAQSAACHSRTLGANLTWTNCGPRQFPARSRSESCPPPPV